MTDVVGNPEEERRADFFHLPWSQEAVCRYFYGKVLPLVRNCYLFKKWPRSNLKKSSQFLFRKIFQEIIISWNFSVESSWYLMLTADCVC